jgi:hypothetical protein
VTAATGQAAPSSPEALASILDQIGSLAKTYGRDDLVDRLGMAKDRLADPSIRVLVVGEYKKGKSTLVNGLLGVTVAPVDDDIATSIPTIVQYGDNARATVTPAANNGESPPPEEVDVNSLADYVSEAGNPANRRGLRIAEVWLPRRVLQGGLVLVDTPGVGGLGSVHTAATLAALPTADAVVFVTDASQEITAPEVEFLRLAIRACPNAVCVMTKTDLYPDWQRMLQLDRDHLRNAGLDMQIIPVSSVLRQVALRTESKETNNESGYPALISYVRNDVVDHAADLARRSVLNDALRAVEYMEQPFVAEAQSLASPEKAQQIAERLAEAKADAERLRSQAARWQQTLSDGFGDLNSDVDQDLRTRMREVTRVAEDALDKSDPGKSWEEFRTWLTQRVTFDIVQNFSVIAERARELAALVAQHFESEAGEIAPQFDIEIPSSTLQGIGASELETKEMRAVAVGFQGLRGAYSNISMFTMAGNMVHMAIGLTNPVTIMIGLLSGGKAIRDVKERELTARRQQAKTSVRRYIDDVNFHVGKDFRDTIRHLQRELRDTFSGRAEELQRSTADALTAVQQTAQKDQGERQQRLQVLDAELKKLATVKQRLAAMAPELATAQPV